MNKQRAPGPHREWEFLVSVSNHRLHGPAGCRPVLAGHRGRRMGGHLTPPRLRVRTRLPLRLLGGGLLTATAATHLDLYLTGYRSIPTIGWLFLLQVVVAFALAAAVLATGDRVIAAAGAGFALATLGGYLLSLWVGSFGFTEVRTTAGIAAGVIEVAAFASLAVLAALPADRGRAAA